MYVFDIYECSPVYIEHKIMTTKIEQLELKDLKAAFNEMLEVYAHVKNETDRDIFWRLFLGKLKKNCSISEGA